MAKRRNKTTIYTMSLGFLLPLCMVAVYVFVKGEPTKDQPELVANVESALSNQLMKIIAKDTSPTDDTTKDQGPFSDTKPIHIKDTIVKASVADSWPERITGLSNTPSLPEDIVKFFVFDSDGEHTIWMKDMNYAIDIIWVDKDGFIVDLVSDVKPESYPDSFGPDKPARYVVETVAGFINKQQIVVGDRVEIPDLN